MRSQCLITKLGLFVVTILFFTSMSCRKSVDVRPNISLLRTSNVIGKFQLGEITKWSNWYDKSIKNAPALEFGKAQTAIVHNRYYVRVPLENSRGMIYFTKTDVLQAVFIRENFKSGNRLDSFPSNIEFIDLNSREYKVVTFKNHKADSLHTLAIPNDASSSSEISSGVVHTVDSDIVKKTDGTFWFDLGCLLSFGIPKWNEYGERVCWGLNLWGWIASLMETGDSGGNAGLGDGYGGEIIGGSYYYGDYGLGNPDGSGGIEGSTTGEYNYIPVFAGDPLALQNNWQSIDDDFFDEFEIDDDDINNDIQGTGYYDYIPSIITLSNGHTIQVEFGYTDDLVNANQMVSTRLIDALKGALEASASLTNIWKIHIKATTNGNHSPKSNHSRKTAVDISRINDVPLILMNGGNGNEQTAALQLAFESQPYRRENYGPSLKHRLGLPYNVSKHKDHIHFAVDNF